MDVKLQKEILQLNPWLKDSHAEIIDQKGFIPRLQIDELLDPEWDQAWTLLVGPRRAGKTTLGKYLASRLIKSGRYKELLYLNCDFLSIRKWLSSPIFISDAIEEFDLKHPILFIDEVQRLENPGLLLKAIIDLNLPIKHIATGSSQLEIKSKVQEFLTGRELTTLTLPLSFEEYVFSLEEALIYGAYPQVVLSNRKEIQLTAIYQRYIQKDIVEILKVGNPDVFQQLLGLIAHSSGQLVRYEQLATDCKVSSTMIRNHLGILEQTFVLAKITPFVGNKRTELTSNPIYYFIDNGFRNVALRNFLPLNQRSDVGLLVEGYVFQEIYKYKAGHYLNFDIHYWRTKSQAEVDFILYKNADYFLPVEVKYQSFKTPVVTRSLRSFIEAYQPQKAVVITKDFIGKKEVDGCNVQFIPITDLKRLFTLMDFH